MTDQRSSSHRPVPALVIFVIIGGAVVLMLVAVIAVATVALRGSSGRDSDRVTAAIRVSLTATSTGTDVRLLINSVDGGRLPGRLELQFTPVDQGINDGGGALTNAALKYGQARDGAGKELSITAPAITIKDVGTDGQQASLSFAVSSAAGRRVIYPIPYASALRFNSISVQGSSTGSCLQSSGSENGRLHYFACTIDPAGGVRYSGGPWAPESIRLELAG